MDLMMITGCQGPYFYENTKPVNDVYDRTQHFTPSDLHIRNCQVQKLPLNQALMSFLTLRSQNINVFTWPGTSGLAEPPCSNFHQHSEQRFLIELHYDYISTRKSRGLREAKRLAQPKSFSGRLCGDGAITPWGGFLKNPLVRWTLFGKSVQQTLQEHPLDETLVKRPLDDGNQTVHWPLHPESARWTLHGSRPLDAAIKRPTGASISKRPLDASMERPTGALRVKRPVDTLQIHTACLSSCQLPDGLSPLRLSPFIDGGVGAGCGTGLKPSIGRFRDAPWTLRLDGKQIRPVRGRPRDGSKATKFWTTNGRPEVRPLVVRRDPWCTY
ncbi:hypothetical protein PCASD_05525 [Puccinia coronata f. sp. avenae]|uniref:Uncharacterized protein n=1 Tax=Puccinia coronata f. sp. avenae TaxID=200324 RepID=A0A2N5UVQ5_9BASI|nr:hypothetical protein PCASD_05525 [Puccinia coronata f. sp. avenae]